MTTKLKGFFDGGLEDVASFASIIDSINTVASMLNTHCDLVELYVDNEYLGNYYLDENEVVFALAE